jgi:hypothetical protein
MFGEWRTIKSPALEEAGELLKEGAQPPLLYLPLSKLVTFSPLTIPTKVGNKMSRLEKGSGGEVYLTNSNRTPDGVCVDTK